MDLPKREFSQVFNLMDQNQDMEVDRYELKCYLALNGIVGDEEEVEYLFQRLDVD